MRGPYFFRLLIPVLAIVAGLAVTRAWAQDEAATAATAATDATDGAADEEAEAAAALPVAIGAVAPVTLRFVTQAEALAEEAPAGQSLVELVGAAESPLVVVWWSPTCPVSTRYAETLRGLATSLGDTARVVVAVRSSAIEADEARTRLADQTRGVRVFVDVDGSVASALAVRVSPTALVFDAGGVLRYRGPIDDDRRARGRDATPLLRPAIDALVAGKVITDPEVRPFGSSLR